MPDPLLPSLAALAACAGGVALGTAAQRLTGAGFGMIAAPVLGLVAPGWLPGAVLLTGLAVGAGAVASDWRPVVPADLPPGFAGRALGAAVAAWIAAGVVGTAALPLTVAGVVLLGVALTALRPRVPIRPATLGAAGLTAGIMGTLTGIGAPPMALLYADVEARRAAATQNVFFAFGMAVSIAALALAGLVGWRHLALAAVLAPVAAATLVAVRPLRGRVGATLRPWALGLSTLAALALIGRTLAG